MEFADLTRIVMSLIAVVGMIAGAAYLARKAGLAEKTGPRSRRRRLAIVETLTLDARRRLAIVACDGREHLIVLGQNGETLIEAGIPARSACEATPDDAAQAAPFANVLASFKNNPFTDQGENADAA